jgi:hypothetical protein
MTENNIKGLDKAELLAALYNASKVQGLGFLQAIDGQMTKAEAATQLESETYFDYLHGKVMKVDLSGDTMQTFLYNRDNGPDAAERVIERLRNPV